MDAQTLLAGPRGRRLCLELALGWAHEPLHSDGEFSLAVFAAAYDLDPGRGTSRVIISFSEGGDGPERPPSASPADVATAWDALPLGTVDGERLLAAVVGSVDMARYWQSPDGEDVLLARPELADALIRTADAVIPSDASRWWDSPIDRDGQWVIEFDADSVDLPRPPARVDAEQVLSEWAARVREQEALAEALGARDPRRAASGAWWSTPPLPLLTSTRAHGSDGPLGLHWVEDGAGWDGAAARKLPMSPRLRVLEIDGAQAWIDLCRAYPLEVTGLRRGTWQLLTGIDSRWVIPDWSAVSQDYDGVHLTVLGYLSAATRALAVGDGVRSIIAGWAPDETRWLVDVAADGATVHRWERDEVDRWRPIP
ncbi:hypothetical protein [Demequina sp. NBRC 110052]|uniref:hypothetical protein n=1 Tax=Demequina sp. NBRC 110052 TaxID=1570341 RepID=UPI000A017E16|nr:hypothetical protein [Demequina sp. NBRC 110052]